MSYKIFLLEKETSWTVTADMNGIILMDKLNNLDRYYQEMNDKSKSSKGKAKKEGLMK